MRTGEGGAILGLRTSCGPGLEALDPVLEQSTPSTAPPVLRQSGMVVYVGSTGTGQPQAGAASDAGSGTRRHGAWTEDQPAASRAPDLSVSVRGVAVVDPTDGAPTSPTFVSPKALVPGGHHRLVSRQVLAWRLSTP